AHPVLNVIRDCVVVERVSHVVFPWKRVVGSVSGDILFHQRGANQQALYRSGPAQIRAILGTAVGGKRASCIRSEHRRPTLLLECSEAISEAAIFVGQTLATVYRIREAPKLFR